MKFIMVLQTFKHLTVCYYFNVFHHSLHGTQHNLMLRLSCLLRCRNCSIQTQGVCVNVFAILDKYRKQKHRSVVIMDFDMPDVSSVTILLFAAFILGTSGQVLTR